jgi:glutamate---cysteine ligase / carboxylate-amine ligase
VIPDAFGESGEWTLGVEEELFVLDAETLEPLPAQPEMLDGVRFKAELHQAVMELNTPVCASLADAERELRALRGEAKRRAAAAGRALAATGTWPTAVAEEQPVTPEPGYLEFAKYAGPSARRQFCNGIHVHVGVPSREACMTALESVLPWLPLMLALSANSPYLAGAETGLASNRAELLGLLPRSGAPPVFASYREWERFAERLLELGLADRYTRIWWDVRPHPGFGTLEIRMPDQPTRVETTLAFAALAHALVAAAEPGPPADRGVYAQNRWAAARFGAHAQLIHPDGSRLVEAGELLDELLDRLQPAGSTTPLVGLAQADEQVAIGRRSGLRSLGESLIALT